ncbi:MAG: molybdopterin oxidoreductase family protein, partial [Micromonosporaceae bacterium]
MSDAASAQVTPRPKATGPGEASRDTAAEPRGRLSSGPAPSVETHCPYCALQCGMTLTPAGSGDAGGAGGGDAGGGSGVRLDIMPRDFPVNQGRLCQKGWTAAELLNTPERLTTPLVRRGGGELEPAGWDTALDLVADRVRQIQTDHGPGAVAVFGGGGLTNEKAYALGKFARVALRTPNIDYNGRFCMSSAAAAGVRAFGIDRGLPFPVSDIAAADAMLLAGGNLAETMPPIMRHFRPEALMVADPRRTPTAAQAALHLPVTPGTDLALALGLLHIAIIEGCLDTAYIEARTSGFAEVRATAMGYWPERVERITGVCVADQRRTVERLAGANRAMILTARGAEQHSKGADTATAFLNLALALGLPGRPGSGYGTITGQGNGQGGREHGQKADQLPGYRMLDDPAARQHVATVWGVSADDLPPPGLSAYELLDAIGAGTGPSAMLLFGSNPVVSAPRSGHVAERLRALDLLVVSDFVLSETAALADVVLPSTQWAEEDGTMTNLEGRVIRRRAAATPPPGARTDLWILHQLAARLGHGEKFPTDPETVFTELGRASAGGPADYAGITYHRIEAEDGVFWPCPDRSHPGTPRLFTERFPTPDGRARFTPVEFRAVAEDTDREFPIYLTTGRVLAHYQSGAQTRRISQLTAAAPECHVELHPDLATRIGVTDGDPVTVRSRRGSITAPARVTSDIRPDTVFLPFHWEGPNRLTNPALDPTSRMPEFKVCAVSV